MLERVIGATADGSASFAYGASNGLLAYPAGYATQSHSRIHITEYCS